MRAKAICLILFLSLTGCAYVEPFVQDFNVISLPQERSLSDQLAAQISKEMTLVTTPSINQTVQKIGYNLAKALPRRDFQYQFFAVQDDTPNAFTIPGGKIYVHTGLLKFASHQNELAGVMAHEIAHASMRHPTKSMSRALGAEQMTQMLFRDTQGKFRALALNLTTGGLLTRYGRQEEREADDLGYQILKRAGYPTDGLLKFLRKLQSLERGGGSSLSFLSSHPPTPERIARLEALERGEVYL